MDWHLGFRNCHTLYVAKELCAGGSLIELYKGFGGAFNELEIAYVCREVLQGDNILLKDVGNVKICDLGLAASLTDPSARVQCVGTLQWDGDYNERCDIWSLGMTAIKLAEGRFPHSSMTNDCIVT
ncbi:mitogen-activated protein kinase kinase kinase kinase 1-like [Denticeps clupeoides]|uniref:mitogen-activated protein kinase kinase kinase kinase 1-like n=1 Tax=Denticeps clupeoides TaxID=299321 RepID=UPI0010A4B9CB|nr:mitogen-activated protein kinase kinase kinase kinase 1-like [Denticeps clupeoides]